MKRIKDQLQRLEDAADRVLDEMEQPDGRWKCSCGELFKPEDAQPSGGPYSAPICQKCFEKMLDELEKQSRQAQEAHLHGGTVGL